MYTFLFATRFAGQVTDQGRRLHLWLSAESDVTTTLAASMKLVPANSITRRDSDLANGNLNVGNIDFVAQVSVDFWSRSNFEKQS